MEISGSRRRSRDEFCLAFVLGPGWNNAVSSYDMNRVIHYCNLSPKGWHQNYSIIYSVRGKAIHLYMAAFFF